MAIKYPLGSRVKHKLSGFGTVINHFEVDGKIVHVIEADGGHEFYAFGEMLEEVYA